MPSELGQSARSSSTDLVAELHQQHDQEIVDGQRRRRRRRTLAIVGVLVTALVLTALGIAGKMAYDRHRLRTAVDAAITHLIAGTPSELESAATSLDAALAVAPGDPESMSLLALVRAHQAATDANPESLDATLSELADSTAPQVALSRGVSAALAGDIVAVESILGEIEPGADTAPMARTRAWLHGTVALGHAYELERLEPAIAELEAVTDGEAWTPVHRWLAALLLRSGRVDDALAALETGRAMNPADLGIASDEALFHAVLGQHAGGVRDVAQRLLAEGALMARDRGRLHLARAIVSARKGKGEEAAKDFDAAWEHLPAWDEDSRALAIASVLETGDAKRAAAWLDEVDPDETTRSIYDAWIELLDGKVVESLEACAKLPQTNARVAYVQALALAEQGRFEEAGPWIERATAHYGPRVELQVAEQRTKAHQGDAKTAAAALAKLAADHEHTPRVFTALGEAQLAAAGEEGSTDEAAKTLRKALEREARPAEAAYLLATLVRKQADSDPNKVAEAIELFAKAAEIDEVTIRYRVALGQYLAANGDLAEAEAVLRTLATDELTPADSFLDLARVVVSRGEWGHVKVDADEFSGWLTEATKRGAPPVEVALLRARHSLLDGDTEALKQTATTLYAVLAADPKQSRARILYGETLRRQGDIVNARTTLRDGGAFTQPEFEGILMVGRAAVERSDGSDRLAASFAWKGWLKIAEQDMPPNERLPLARKTAEYWEEIENRPVQRSISKSIVDRMPWRADAWAFRAMTQLADGQADEGCASADKALELDPELGEAHGARAECDIAKRRYEQAREGFGKAIKLALSDSEATRYKRRLRILR